MKKHHSSRFRFRKMPGGQKNGDNNLFASQERRPRRKRKEANARSFSEGRKRKKKKGPGKTAKRKG